MLNPDENLRRAASVNAAHYNAVRDSDALADNPHIRNRATRQFYYKLMADTFAFARQHTATPRVLDLGGGDGFAALLFFGIRRQGHDGRYLQQPIAKAADKCR